MVQALSEPETGIDPLVAPGPSRDVGMIAFFVVLALGGIVLFTMLSSGREAYSSPATKIAAGTFDDRIVSPPPLNLQPRTGPRELRPVRFEEPARTRLITPPTTNFQPSQASNDQPAATSQLPRFDEPPVEALPFEEVVGSLVENGQGVVFQGSDARQPVARTAPPFVPQAASGSTSDRVVAYRFENPSRTVPRGTVIPAVLETALDSTRPGGVRALISRDVRSFDGTRVLIPRGSRLYGEYSAELQPGQARALVTWQRLMRPDGAIIAIDSPASDPLGRAGLKGNVETHFWERLGESVLGSVIDVGVGVATSEVLGGGLIVGLPQGRGGSSEQTSGRYQRSLRVRQGASVSVFVARDLDFSTVE